MVTEDVVSESTAPASFLVAEDDEYVARVFVKALTPHGRVDVALSFVQARSALETNAFSAIVVDVGLPDGSGMEIVRSAKERDPNVAALVVSGRVDAARLAQAHALDAHFLLKPVDPVQLAVFVERARTRAVLRHARTEALVEEWTARFSLTSSEAGILRLAALGAERSQLAEARHVAPSTIKKQVQTLLDKIGAPSLDIAVNRLLRAALEAS